MGQAQRPKGFASRRRIKPEKGSAYYHVMSRTVNGEFLFGNLEKEVFQRFKDRFCDVSLFVKELKERFSRWFSK